MSQERSAEFYRGAKWILDGCCDPWVAYALDRRLAEAEAREASVPTAAEVIAAAERALEEAEDQLVALCSRGDVPSSLTNALAAIAKWKEAHNA